MKAISLWQPWAQLAALGAKRIETRSWATSYRGPIAIHACARSNPELTRTRFSEPFNSALVAGGWGRAANLPLGRIVGVCVLSDCFFIPRTVRFGAKANFLRDLTTADRAFGDFTPGRFAWILHRPRQLDAPIPFRGAQKFFEIPFELEPAAEVHNDV